MAKAILVRLADIPASFWRLIKRNPVRAQAVVQVAIGTATAFGLGWSGVQVAQVVALSAVLLAFLTESAVTPLDNPTLPAGTRVTVSTAEGEPNRVERL